LELSGDLPRRKKPQISSRIGSVRISKIKSHIISSFLPDGYTTSPFIIYQIYRNVHTQNKKSREEILPGSGMLPHPGVQSPAAGGHVDAQFLLRREALPLPAAFAQQKVKKFTNHGGSLPFSLLSIIYGFLSMMQL
jgi:hypothetical protein